MEINKNVFVHETDRVALQALHAIPGFTQILKAFMNIWNERVMYIKNMATNVRISDKQLKKYYDMLPPICDKLGIEVPDLFLELNVEANAWTSGDTKPYITITSGLIETVPEELIPTVLAHECGHIACHHVLYRTMGEMIMRGALNYLLPSDIAKYISVPLRSAFLYWMRCSEFSADRAAILCDGTPEKVMEMCARFAGFDKDILSDINMEEFMNQAEGYSELVNSNAFNKGIEFLSFGFNSHPINAVRASEAYKWSQSEDFIKSKQYFESYERGEEPIEFPILWNEKHFVGKNFLEVKEELLNVGFSDVEMVRSTDKQVLTKEGSVFGVKIDNSNKYKDADWYPADAKVEISYYLPYTDAEIAEQHSGEAKITGSAKYYIGKPFKDVVKEFEELGFINIATEEIKDLKKEKDKNLGKVYSITINKSPKFSKGDWISQDAEIKIVYHDKM